jgi:hypothetical protein
MRQGGHFYGASRTSSNPAPAAAMSAVRLAKLSAKILPALYAARDYACTPAGRAAVEKALQAVCGRSKQAKDAAAEAMMRPHNGQVIVGTTGAYVTTADGKRGTVGHRTLTEAKEAIDNPRRNNPLVEFTTKSGRKVSFDAKYSRSWTGGIPPQPKKTAAKKKIKKPTYKAAMKGIYDALKADGWKMSSPSLNTPHATKGNVRLYLKPQGVHKTTKKPFKLGDAHSLTFGIDVRDITNYGAFVKQFNKYAGAKSNPKRRSVTRGSLQRGQQNLF